MELLYAELSHSVHTFLDNLPPKNIFPSFLFLLFLTFSRRHMCLYLSMEGPDRPPDCLVINDDANSDIIIIAT